MSESKAEIQGALWRIPPVDDTEPPLDSPGISPGSGHSRSLQLICHFDNKHENIRRLVYIHVHCKHFRLKLYIRLAVIETIFSFVRCQKLQ